MRPKSRFTYSFYKLFAVIVLMMFLVNLLFVFMVIQDYQKNLEAEDLTYLTAISERIEQDLSEGLQNIVFTLFKAQDYNVYVNASSNKAEKNIIMVRLRDEFKRILNGPGNVFSDLAMYYPDTEELLSGTFGYLQLSRASNRSYRRDYNIDRLPAQAAGMHVVAGTYGETSAVTAIYRFPNKAAAIFVLRQDYFDKLFYKDFVEVSDQSGILIQDRSGSPLYLNGPQVQAWLSNRTFLDKTQALGEESLSFHVNNEDGHDYVCTVDYARALDLHLLKLNDVGIIKGLRNYSWLLTLFIAVTGATILLGYYITYRFSNKLLRPIQAIVNSLRGESAPRDAHVDELQFIGNYLEASKAEKKKMEKIISFNQSLIKDKFVKYMVEYETQDAESVRESLAMLDMDFDSDCYAAIEITLSEAELSNATDAERSLLKMHLIYEIETAYETGRAQILACDYAPNTIVLIIGTDRPWQAEIAKLIRFIEQFIQTNYNTPFFIAVGRVQDSHGTLGTSYQSAKALRKASFFLGDGVLHQCADELTQTPPQPREPFANMVSSSEPTLNGARFVLAETRKLFAQAPLSADNRELLAHIVPYFINVLNASSLVASKEGLEPLLYPRAHFWRVSGFFSYVEERLAAADEKDDAQDDLRGKLNRYIEDNLADDLSLDVLASHVGLSPKYISKLYKEQTGMNLTTYVVERRIERAAKLLRNTDKTVEATALETGFSSGAYFIKCFKRIMGTTPKLYRDC